MRVYHFATLALALSGRSASFARLDSARQATSASDENNYNTSYSEMDRFAAKFLSLNFSIEFIKYATL